MTFLHASQHQSSLAVQVCQQSCMHPESSCSATCRASCQATHHAACHAAFKHLNVTAGNFTGYLWAPCSQLSLSGPSHQQQLPHQPRRRPHSFQNFQHRQLTQPTDHHPAASNGSIQQRACSWTPCPPTCWAPSSSTCCCSPWPRSKQQHPQGSPSALAAASSSRQHTLPATAATAAAAVAAAAAAAGHVLRAAAAAAFWACGVLPNSCSHCSSKHTSHSTAAGRSATGRS